jgi:hypothetical protein
MMIPLLAALITMSPGTDITPVPPMPLYRPFIDPLNLHEWWFLLLIPMAFLVAMTYKAIRLATLDQYWKHVLIMTAQIIVGMIALGATTYMLVFWFARFVAERAA